MERIAVDVIKRKKGVWFDISNSDRFMIAGFMGLGFLLIFAAFFHKFYNISIHDHWGFQIVTMICVVSIISRDIWVLDEYEGNDLEVSTVLFFDENEISLGYTQTFALTEIAYIKFTIMDYKGYRTVGTETLKKSSGTSNYIEFSHKNKVYKLRFRIESRGHMQLLKEKLIPQLRNKTKVIYR